VGVDIQVPATAYVSKSSISAACLWTVCGFPANPSNCQVLDR